MGVGGHQHKIVEKIRYFARSVFATIFLSSTCFAENLETKGVTKRPRTQLNTQIFRRSLEALIYVSLHLFLMLYSFCTRYKKLFGYKTCFDLH